MMFRPKRTPPPFVSTPPRSRDEPVPQEYPKCSNCDDDWHGLPTPACAGSLT